MAPAKLLFNASMNTVTNVIAKMLFRFERTSIPDNGKLLIKRISMK